MSLPSTRKKARKLGSKHYYTGKPCKNGHKAPRVTTRAACLECIKQNNKKSNERRKGQPKSEAAKAAARRYYEKNKEKVKARAKAQPVEDRRRYRAKHREKNADFYRAYNNSRRRRHRFATPPNQSPEDKAAIKAIYAEAQRLTKERGELYTVDHIVPLRGERVCGLHVPWNLEILTQSENSRKGNSYPYDDDEN